MHPRLRAGALDDGGCASDVVRVSVREDDVAEIFRSPAQRAQRVEDRGLVIRKARIDQHEFAVVSLKQNAVDVAEGHKPRLLNDLFHRVCLSSAGANL